MHLSNSSIHKSNTHRFTRKTALISHRDYLKEHRPVLFNQLVLSGNLWTYLADINEQAQHRMEVLVKQMMAFGGVTEELKEANQMEWVQWANNLRSRSESIVLNELILT